MVDISRKVEVTVSVSAFDLGRAFAAMRSDEQAQFFNGISAATRGWEKPDCFQWQMMRDDMDGLPDALSTFRAMAEYAD